MAMADVTPVPGSPEREELKSKMDLVKMSEEEAAGLGLVELISRMEWRHVMDRIKDSPEEIRKKQIVEVDGTETMGYALHLAVSKKPPRHVVDALMEGYPDAIRARDDKFGQLPLHIACIHTASAQVLRALVEGHEESLRITDKEHGRLPLHFACLYGSPFEISLLVSAEQRALIFKDADGKTPKDLAEESSNPHREVILKRLEDRIRVVTEAMQHRRKQQQSSESPPDQKTKRSSLRRSSSKRGDLLSGSQSSMMDAEKRRTKSISNGSNDEEVSLKKPSGTISRTRSMVVPSTEPPRRRGSHSIRSGGSGMSSEQKRRSFRRTHTLDDSDLGKKSKSTSRRKRDGLQKGSRHSFSRGPIAPMPLKGDAEVEDVEKTPKLKNGKESLLARLQAEHGDDHRRSLQPAPPDLMNSSREKPKPRRDHLAMFLQAHAPDDSSDEDFEADHKSMGARSLPAHMASSFSRQRHGEFAENKRIAKSYMFDDSSDDGGGGYSRGPGMSRGFNSDDGLASRRGHAIGHTTVQKSSKLVSVEGRIGDLDVRRLALSQECEAIYETVGKKEDRAKQSRETINELQLQMQDLQERLQKEQSALMLSETGIQLQKETLAVHEIKIKAVDSEKSQLLETKSNLEAAESVSNVVASD